MWTIDTADVAATQGLGRSLAQASEAGTTVALIGDLGAGKTSFAQGVGAGLDVTEPIVSPSFVLMTEYMGRLVLLHADTYRLSAGELAGVGIEDAIDGHRGLALIEWADRFPELLPADHLVVRIAYLADQRRIRVEAMGPRSAATLSRWRAAHGG
jgi:tRNA threonylcarbamoyladenosine biosynthesis protein TsaE